MPYDTVSDSFENNIKYSTYDDSQYVADKLITNVSEEIKTMIADPEKYNLNKDEIKAGIALTELLDNWEEILKYDGSNKLQKSSVLYFLREETMMTTKSVRDNMKKFKSAYYMLKKILIES